MYYHPHSRHRHHCHHRHLYHRHDSNDQDRRTGRLPLAFMFQLAIKHFNRYFSIWNHPHTCTAHPHLHFNHKCHQQIILSTIILRIILDNNRSVADVKTLKAGMAVEDWLVLTNRADIDEKEMVGRERHFYL